MRSQSKIILRSRSGGVTYARYGIALFCVTIIAALTVVPAAGEQPDVNAVRDPPWHRICVQGDCFVSKSRWTYCGLVGNASLIERKTETAKHLGIELPTRINPERPVRITIDQTSPSVGRFQVAASLSAWPTTRRERSWSSDSSMDSCLHSKPSTEMAPLTR
jgi:hypothetical protein